ncbi:MAG TPA: hypothetical protein VF070_43880, partial [Streptosporangiaceae bacterium]
MTQGPSPGQGQDDGEEPHGSPSSSPARPDSQEQHDPPSSSPARPDGAEHARPGHAGLGQAGPGQAGPGQSGPRQAGPERPPAGGEQGRAAGRMPRRPVQAAGFADGAPADVLVPGPDLAGLVHAVTGSDGAALGTLTDAEVLGVIAASRRLAA